MRILLLLLIFMSEHTYAQNKLIVSCCEKKAGRCTGSDYCTACSNCTRCAHCNSGGTCGVCSRRNSNTYETPQPEKTRTSSKYLAVKSEVLNLRSGPGTNYDILEKLTKGQRLIVLNREGEWIKVRVANTGTEGYVHRSYVKDEE